MTNTPSFLDNALRMSMRYAVRGSLVGIAVWLLKREAFLFVVLLAIWGAVIGFCSTKPVQPNRALSFRLVLMAMVASSLITFLCISVSPPNDVSDMPVVVALGLLAVLGGFAAAWNQFQPAPKDCLQTVNPQLAAEWHPTKNWGVTPRDVTATRMRKVWWKCPNGHEWRADIESRQKGSGCPMCKT